MKKKLLYLSAGAYLLSLTTLSAVSYKINGQDADTPTDIGNEMFTTAAYYCQTNESGAWVDIPLADRVLPNFTSDAIKFDNVNVTLNQSFDVFKFEGLYYTNLVITGTDTVANFSDNIWGDGAGTNTIKILDGATVTMANDFCANNSMETIDILGSADKNTTFNGSFGSVETVVNLDRATWYNEKHGTWVNQNGVLTLSNTTWTNTAGGLDINTPSTADNTSALVELKDGNVVNLAGNIRLGGSNGASGTATLLISGNNNELTATNLEGPVEGRSGGDSVLKVTGNDNTIFIDGGNINLDGYVVNGPITGGSQGVDIQGEGNVFKGTNRMHIGRNDGNSLYEGGTAYFRISSSSAENKARLYLASSVNLGLGDGESSTYVSEFTIGGNTVVRAMDEVSALESVNIGTGGASTPTGGTAVFNVQGANNDVLIGNVNVMHVQASGTASGYFNIKGTNNLVRITDSLRISTLSGGDGTSITNGNGYVSVSGTGNTLIVDNETIIGNHDRASAGLARFTVEGTGNTVTLNTVKLGAGTDVTGGNGRFIVKGSGNTIDINGHIDCWSPVEAAGNPDLASGFEFIFDASGISTITLNGTSGIGGAVFLVDLSGLIGIFDESTNGKFTLISSVNDFDFDPSRAQIILREGDKEGAAGLKKEFDENNNYVLNLYYSSSVPEPATYALVFGALAMFFAMSRRSKRN